MWSIEPDYHAGGAIRVYERGGVVNRALTANTTPATRHTATKTTCAELLFGTTKSDATKGKTISPYFFTRFCASRMD